MSSMIHHSSIRKSCCKENPSNELLNGALSVSLHFHSVFFKNILEDLSPFLWPLIGLLALLVTCPMGFKARVGNLVCACQRRTCYQRFTTGVTLGGQHGS